MKKIRLLDLCCGAGSCAMGYKLAVDDIDYTRYIGNDFLKA